jgi:hypothetical protein
MNISRILTVDILVFIAEITTDPERTGIDDITRFFAS